MLQHVLQKVISIDLGNAHGRNFLTQAIHGHCPRHKHPLEKMKEDDAGALWPYLFLEFPGNKLNLEDFCMFLRTHLKMKNLKKRWGR